MRLSPILVCAFTHINKVTMDTRVAEQFLTENKIPFTKQADGFLHAKGDIYLSHKGLTELPDLSCVILTGNFKCSGNRLTSLKGAPRSVSFDFDCTNNKLTSLEGGPQGKCSNYSCNQNKLVTLKGAAQEVSGTFDAGNNELVSLEGGPLIVGFNYGCGANRLETLAGAPARLDGGSMTCQRNPLLHLEGAPQHDGQADSRFTGIESDLGNFKTHDQMPDHIRWSPQTLARRRVDELNKAIRDATTILQDTTLTSAQIPRLKIGKKSEL